MATVGDAEWRLEVGRTRAAHRRRALPLTVNVGVPAGPRVTATLPWPPPRELDAGLRFDVVDAVLDQWLDQWLDQSPDRGQDDGPACAWTTRPGVPNLHDEDQLWHAAARHAFEAREVGLVTFRTVTHTGWLDVVTGESTTWRRLRLSAS
ncbi:hypothetical protein [Nocardioides caldifontis]|uniref:hypothetical protein n=1 Tax=Nocardioides caldifontis TaxID=2588938 RepID=UPI0011DF8A01|nr:hypothetical protein [Nocardioides caldifontis]